MRRARRGAAGGYTLMELIIAAMLAMMVSAGLWAVYATHSRVFRSQEMVAQAQFGARFALETVLSDLQRAGYQAVADTTDPRTKQRLCGAPAIGDFQAVTLTHNSGGVANPGSNVTGVTSRPPEERPDQLVLVGNYVNDDVYWADKVVGTTVTLQNTTKIDPTDPYPQNATQYEKQIFTDDKRTLLRIRNQDKVFFSVVTGASQANKTITLANSPSCGNQGLWSWGEVNVVNKVRYRVVAPSLAAGTLTKSEDNLLTSGKRAGLTQRFDLVREYLDWTNNNVLVTDVLAENVVDFQVWFLFSSLGTPAGTGPTVDQVAAYGVSEAITGGPPCNTAGEKVGDANCEAWNIYGAIVRISVRTADEDRNWHIPIGAPRQPLRYYEVEQPTDPTKGPNSAARVRTLVGQIDMPNLGYGR